MVLTWSIYSTTFQLQSALCIQNWLQHHWSISLHGILLNKKCYPNYWIKNTNLQKNEINKKITLLDSHKEISEASIEEHLACGFWTQKVS